MKLFTSRGGEGILLYMSTEGAIISVVGSRAIRSMSLYKLQLVKAQEQEPIQEATVYSGFISQQNLTRTVHANSHCGEHFRRKASIKNKIFSESDDLQ